MGYLANFIVYTLAMVGVMGLALITFKKFAIGGCKTSSSKNLRVLDSMTLAPRKSLYIVSAGDEKFLIASDADRTTLISKLGETKQACEQTSSLGVRVEPTTSAFQETMSQLSEKTRYADRGKIGIKSSQNTPYTSVMRSLAERIKE